MKREPAALIGKRAESVYQPLEWLTQLRSGVVAGEVLAGLDKRYRTLLEAILSREPAELPGMEMIAERLRWFMAYRASSLSV